MLTNNKSYDNSNIRDHLKVFNDGVIVIYKAKERILESVKGMFYFSKESVSYKAYTGGYQNGEACDYSVGIPHGGDIVKHGDVAEIEGRYYIVDHVQYKDYERPVWYQLYLTESTLQYSFKPEGDEEVQA